MMHKIITLLLFFVFLFSAQLDAQFPNFGRQKSKSIKGKITGKIIDTLTNEAIGFASVALKKAGSDKIVNGVISEEDGSFKLGEVLTGKYDVYISFLGFKEKVIRNVETTLKDPDHDLEKVYMSQDAEILDEVEIVEERALFENKVDKIVFNAENDASIAGGDATEVLRKVPLLTVDLDGNVSLRGSQNVQILINGKPSGMFSANVAEALKMFPADQIKKVEVITSPSAKYDGEGSAGIINIVTKRDNIEGIAGSINASAGNIQNNAFVNLNVGKGRFGFTSNGSVFYSIPQDGRSSFTRSASANGLTSLVNQDGIQETSRLGFNGTLSAFYDFNAFNAINSSLKFRGFGFDTDGEVNGLVEDNINNIFDEFVRSNVGDNLFSGFDWNTDYTRKFEENEGQEFSVAIQVSGNVNNQFFELIENHTDPILNRNEIQDNDGDNIETTFQLDYTHPISKGKLEVGAKSVIRDIDSDYDFRVFDEVSNDYQIDSRRSNVFLYDQDVYAGYVNLTYTLAKKYSVVAGLRYERTDIAGDFQSGEGFFENGYNSWLPNFTISRSLPKFRTLKFSFSRRIQRPTLRFVNPFDNSVDFYNRTIGNPTLRPELVDQYEISYNTSIAGATVFATPFFKRTTDIIEQIIGVQQGISVNTYDNVGTNNSFGLNLFITKNVGRVTLRGGGNFFTYDGTGIVNGETRETQAFLYNLFSNGDIKLSGTIKMDFFGFYRAPRQTLQGTQPSFSIFGMGVRKEFKNSSIGIRVIEPFAADKAFDSEIIGNNFTQISSFTIPFRSVGINFRYKFGKVDFRERKSKIKNDDGKQGGDGQGGQQQGGGGGAPARG